MLGTGSIGSMIFGAGAVLALVVLIAAVYRAREDGFRRISVVLAVVPVAFVAWTFALRFVDLGADRLWFYLLATIWGAVMIATMVTLTILVIRSERKSVAMVAFFLFPVLGIYLGFLQLILWAAGAS